MGRLLAQLRHRRRAVPRVRRVRALGVSHRRRARASPSPTRVDVQEVREMAEQLRPRPTGWTPPQGPYCVCVAALNRKKAHDTLLRAFARVPEPMRLILVGDGPLRAELTSLVAQLGLDAARRVRRFAASDRRGEAVGGGAVRGARVARRAVRHRRGRGDGGGHAGDRDECRRAARDRDPRRERTGRPGGRRARARGGADATHERRRAAAAARSRRRRSREVALRLEGVGVDLRRRGVRERGSCRSGDRRLVTPSAPAAARA